MINTTTLIVYVAIVLGFVFIPGPATLLTVARATSSGTKIGIAIGAGIAAGDVIHTFMAIIGISAASAALFSIVKYLGAAYLIYLGIQAIFAKTASDPAAERTLPITAQKAFSQAILAEVLNPKTALFFLAFLPQFVRPENGSVALQLAVVGDCLRPVGPTEHSGFCDMRCWSRKPPPQKSNCAEMAGQSGWKHLLRFGRPPGVAGTLNQSTPRFPTFRQNHSAAAVRERGGTIT